ncbi:MAG: hypothetical protein M3342_17805 [Bacteroidota bacterium]|nr:hypothetical protein [Bacteroidota bacterium]
MQRRKIEKTTSINTYIGISVIGLLLSFLSLYFYFHNIQGNVTELTDQKFYYFILILFGVAISALLFGVMHSYAILKGEKLSAKYQFTGPIVGVILTVMGGFYLPKGNSEGIITFRIFDEQKNPVTHGTVSLYIPNVPEQKINNHGEAKFTDIPENHLLGNIRVNISSDGYRPLVIDTLLRTNHPIYFTLEKINNITVYGRVKDAGEYPINHVEISVDGTNQYTYSLTDGAYSLKLTGYSIGDEIDITTSHKDYEDKTFKLKIESPEVIKDIILKPSKH